MTVHTGAKTIFRRVGVMLDNVLQLQHIMTFSVAAHWCVFLLKHDFVLYNLES